MIFSLCLSIVSLISVLCSVFFLSSFNIFDQWFQCLGFSQILSNSLLPGHTCLFLCMLCNSWLRVRYSEFYSLLTLEIRFSHSCEITDLCLLRACPLVPFPSYFYKACIPSCVVTEVSVLLSLWLGGNLKKISLNVWLLKGVPVPVGCGGGKLLAPEGRNQGGSLCRPHRAPLSKHADWTL